VRVFYDLGCVLPTDSVNSLLAFGMLRGDIDRWRYFTAT